MVACEEVSGNDITELEYLVRRLNAATRPNERDLILSDVVQRLPVETTEQARFAKAVHQSGRDRSTLDACILLLEGFVERFRQSLATVPVDLLIVCPKPVELIATKILLAIDLESAPTEVHPDGYHFFDGEFTSRATGDTVSYRLVCLGGQTNTRAAHEVGHILQIRPARLAALVGMAAGVPGKCDVGDVVMAEQVCYIATGSRLDAGMVAEPEPFRLDMGLAREFATATPQYFGWYDEYERRLEVAVSLNLELPPGNAAHKQPRLRQGVILSDEMKDETTSLEERARRYHGDAKALDMESAGFALACESSNKTPWLVFRGIADFGFRALREPEEGLEGTDDLEPAEPGRSKEWQLAATLASGSAFLVWIRTQMYFWQRTRSEL